MATTTATQAQPTFGKEFKKGEKPVSKEIAGPSGIEAIYRKKLKNLFRDKLELVFAGKDLVGHILTRFAVKNISGAPVVRKNEMGEITEVLGFVDMLDILAYLMKISGVSVSEAGEATPISEEHLRKLSFQNKEFNATPIENIIGLSGRNPFFEINENATILDALQQRLTNYHRIVLKDDSGRLTGIVTQSLICKYLSDNLHRIKFDPKLSEKIQNFPHKTASVMVVDRTATVLDAFVQMHASKLSAVGIVDEEGRLVGNLSASDLKVWHLYENRLRLLLRSVDKFLNHTRKFQYRAGDFVVTLKNDNTWLDLLNAFNKNFVHRVYIVDNNNKPSGVISLTDFMKVLVPATATATQEKREGVTSE
jgi:predicted transcriptional regulator